MVWTCRGRIVDIYVAVRRESERPQRRFMDREGGHTDGWCDRGGYAVPITCTTTIINIYKNRNFRTFPV